MLTREEIREKLREKENRKRELAKRIDKADLSELREINKELDALNDEIAELRDQLDAATPIERREGSPVGRTQILAAYGLGTGGGNLTNRGVMTVPEDKERIEARAAALREGKAVTYDLSELNLRTVTIGGGTLALPTHTSPTVAPGFNEVSALIDLVNVVNLPGGESYAKGFVKSYGEGGYTAEGADYTTAEPVFDYVSTGKHKITAYAEITSEALKLPAADYDAEVKKGITIALRKKISRQILIGTGVEQLTGIFFAPEKVIPAASDVSLTTINADTLDNLVFGYGGSESIEGGTWLILNKATLALFNAVRATDGKKLYKITLSPDGNTGTITSDESFAVNFVINSAIPGFNEAAAGDYVLAYGKPLGYELPVFSPVTVERSEHFKFKQGIVAYRGEVYCGGAPAGWKIFLRAKKGA